MSFIPLGGAGTRPPMSQNTGGVLFTDHRGNPSGQNNDLVNELSAIAEGRSLSDIYSVLDRILSHSRSTGKDEAKSLQKAVEELETLVQTGGQQQGLMQQIARGIKQFAQNAMPQKPLAKQAAQIAGQQQKANAGIAKQLAQLIKLVQRQGPRGAFGGGPGGNGGAGGGGGAGGPPAAPPAAGGGGHRGFGSHRRSGYNRWALHTDPNAFLAKYFSIHALMHTAKKNEENYMMMVGQGQNNGKPWDALVTVMPTFFHMGSNILESEIALQRAIKDGLIPTMSATGEDLAGMGDQLQRAREALHQNTRFLSRMGFRDMDDNLMAIQNIMLATGKKSALDSTEVVTMARREYFAMNQIATNTGITVKELQRAANKEMKKFNGKVAMGGMSGRQQEILGQFLGTLEKTNPEMYEFVSQMASFGNATAQRRLFIGQNSPGMFGNGMADFSEDMMRQAQSAKDLPEFIAALQQKAKAINTNIGSAELAKRWDNMEKASSGFLAFRDQNYVNRQGNEKDGSTAALLRSLDEAFHAGGYLNLAWDTAKGLGGVAGVVLGMKSFLSLNTVATMANTAALMANSGAGLIGKLTGGLFGGGLGRQAMQAGAGLGGGAGNLAAQALRAGTGAGGGLLGRMGAGAGKLGGGLLGGLGRIGGGLLGGIGRMGGGLLGGIGRIAGGTIGALGGPLGVMAGALAGAVIAEGIGAAWDYFSTPNPVGTAHTPAGVVSPTVGADDDHWSQMQANHAAMMSVLGASLNELVRIRMASEQKVQTQRNTQQPSVLRPPAFDQGINVPPGR